MSDPKNAAHRVSVKCICIADNKVLMLHLTDKHRTLVGGGVDEGEDLISTIQREFQEETGVSLPTSIEPQLVHAEIKQFPQAGKFSAVVNLFYVLRFPEIFTPIPEQGVYSAFRRCTLEEFL